MQHCYSTISSYGIFHIHIPYKFATSVYGKKAMAEVKDRYNSSAAAEVPQGAHGGEGSGRSGAGASGEPGRKCCRVFFFGVTWGRMEKELKRKVKWILMPKKGFVIYICIYILWTYSYVWLFWRYKMELRVRTNWWIDAAFGLMISHCDGSGDLTWNIVVSRCFKGIKV